MKKIILLVLVLMMLVACGGGEEESELEALEARVIELEKQLDIMLLGLQADYGKKVSIDTPPIQIEKNTQMIQKLMYCQLSLALAKRDTDVNIAIRRLLLIKNGECQEQYISRN